MNNEAGKSCTHVGDAWYTEQGVDNDVVLSTRVRLSRNLVNYPFAPNISPLDAERVKMLCFDAFSKLSARGKEYQAVPLSNLDDVGYKILVERGVLENSCEDEKNTGVVMRTDGKISCTVNHIDHLRIASFVPGLNVNESYELSKTIDDELQEFLQFAASVNFGYLTASLNDTGTGMRVSSILHLPSLGITKGLKNLFEELSKKGIAVSALFGPSSKGHAIGSHAAALGDYYKVCTGTAFPYSEKEQLQNFFDELKRVVFLEREARKQVCVSIPTQLQNAVFRAYASILYGRLMNESEAIDIISSLKWGCDCSLLDGMSEAEFFSLLFRIRPAHLSFANKSTCLQFESDIQSEELQVQRLRLLMMQEAAEKLHIFQTADGVDPSVPNRSEK